VEEAWAIEIDQFSPFLAGGKKSHSGEIQVTRKTPPDSFPAKFILKDNALLIYFTKHRPSGDSLVIQDGIKINAFCRKGFFQAKWLFECPHCNEYFEKLYLRFDDRRNNEQFSCRVGNCLSYASRLKYKNLKGV
jgi:hypothetical protein